jgi:hypothetical protein
MLARTTAIGIVAAIAVALQELSPPAFTLRSAGAVDLHAEGHEARYSVLPDAVRNRPVIMISLGATSSTGALQLTVLGDRPPAPGRYPVRSSWDELPTDPTAFHASFMPGTVERPLGWYHGDSGWVTITGAQGDRLAGTFEVHASGFSAADPLDEEQRVTVQGSFDATASD